MASSILIGSFVMLRYYWRKFIWGVLTGSSLICLTFKFQNLYLSPASLRSLLQGYLVFIDGAHAFLEESIILVISLSILLYLFSSSVFHLSSLAFVSSSVAACNNLLLSNK